MLPDLQPHIEAARAAARARLDQRLDTILRDAAGPDVPLPSDSARALVVVAPGVALARPHVRLRAWAALAAARGHAVDTRRVRFEIALIALRHAPLADDTIAAAGHRLIERAYLERARDRIDLPAGEVAP